MRTGRQWRRTFDERRGLELPVAPHARGFKHTSRAEPTGVPNMNRTQPQVAGKQIYGNSRYVAGSAGRSIYAQGAATGTRATDAAQFMPFAALTGYYATVREQELELGAEPRRALTEERAEEVSRMLARLQKGDHVVVTHYGHDRYVITSGRVRQVDTTFRTLELVSAQGLGAKTQSAGNNVAPLSGTTTRVLFEDIWELSWANSTET